MKKAILLSDKFTYKKLIRYTLPSIIMMIFTSIYGVVDGLFVSNFAGKSQFAAINLIMPLLMILSTVGFMIGAGGSALVSRTLGQGDTKKANETFTLLVFFAIALGITLAVIGILILKPIAVALGAKGELLENCVLYGTIILPVLPFYILQNAFQNFLITAGKPKLGLGITVVAGVTNIVFDAILILGFKLGLTGAAIATAFSQVLGGVIPIIYFTCKNKSSLRFTKTRFNGRALIKTCTNGASELVSTVSMSIVNILFNYQLMRFAGEDGIAAFGVIMYVNFIFMAVFLGYSMGSAPIIGYHYGANNTDELKSVTKKSLILISLGGLIITALAEALAYPLSYLFVGYDKALFQMTTRAFMIYSLYFLLVGYNLFSSAFFTALNNGFVSSLISFLRTLVFQVACVIVLPIWLGIDGVWISIIVAEVLALAVTIICFIRYRKRYKY